MSRNRPRGVRAVAWSLVGLTTLEQAAVLALFGLNGSVLVAGQPAFDAVLVVAVGLCAGVGLLIERRLPGIAIGWLLSVIGLLLAGSMVFEQYALHGLATAPASVPAPRLAGWCAGLFSSMTIVLLFFLVLLFPDGRLPSRRWRPVLWAMFAVAAAWTTRAFRPARLSAAGSASRCPWRRSPTRTRWRSSRGMAGSAT